MTEVTRPAMYERGTGACLVTDRFPFPAGPDEYFAARSEPIDGWYQAANSSNMRTTVEIVRTLCERYDLGRPTQIVDPFAGAGSSAMAARLLGVPFVGIELDPVLACITIAKLRASAELLEGAESSAGSFARYMEIIERARAISGYQGGVPRENVSQSETLPHPESRLRQGDAGDAEVWKRLLPARDQRTVLYTSPPFGHTFVPPWPKALTMRAEEILIEDELLLTPVSHGAPSYGELTVAMLRNAVDHLEPGGLLVLEHEPAAGGENEAAEAAERLERHVRGLKLLEVCSTDNFSGKGVFSLIVCQVG